MASSLHPNPNPPLPLHRPTSSVSLPSPSLLLPCCSSCSRPLLPRRTLRLSVPQRRRMVAACAKKGAAIEAIEEGKAEAEAEVEEAPPLLENAERNSKPRRIALFVEPSPFAYVSGYKNRFQNFIKHLREMGDEVIVVTTHEGVPQEFYGAKLIGSWRDKPYLRKVQKVNPNQGTESLPHPKIPTLQKPNQEEKIGHPTLLVLTLTTQLRRK